MPDATDAAAVPLSSIPPAPGWRRKAAAPALGAAPGTSPALRRSTGDPCAAPSWRPAGRHVRFAPSSEGLHEGTPLTRLPDRLESGSPYPLGATFDGLGINFAVFSANAERID